MTTDAKIGEMFLTETIHRLNKSFMRIKHCLQQLDDVTIWWTPNDQMNSIGNLVLHLDGNLRQWILHGVGGQEDHRDRPKEFETSQMKSKQDLKELLSELQTEIVTCLHNCDSGMLAESRRIQGFDTKLLSAIYGTMTHLEGHTGQIVYITRLRKGANYQLFWIPETEEQASKKG